MLFLPQCLRGWETKSETNNRTGETARGVIIQVAHLVGNDSNELTVGWDEFCCHTMRKRRSIGLSKVLLLDALALEKGCSGQVLAEGVDSQGCSVERSTCLVWMPITACRTPLYCRLWTFLGQRAQKKHKNTLTRQWRYGSRHDVRSYVLYPWWH